MTTRYRSAVGHALAALVLLAGLSLAACGAGGSGSEPVWVESPQDDSRISVVTTIAPLRSIVENVGGDRVTVRALVPEGTNSHTYEPPPSAAEDLAGADLIVINGLDLELPTLELAESNAGEGVEILLLGERTIEEDEYVFDFSFPESEGSPNPHLWTAPHLSIRYAELVEVSLRAVDPEAGDYYAGNLARFRQRLQELDDAIAEATATIPAGNRKLLSYHDSFPFFGSRYGLEILGAVQPSDFSEPSPREVASLVEQIRDSGVPAIFGSEVFPSEVLEVIADEAGAVQISTLRDDDLPGEPGDPENTLVAMLVENARTMTTALGGDAGALDGFDTADTWRPFAELDEEEG